MSKTAAMAATPYLALNDKTQARSVTSCESHHRYNRLQQKAWAHQPKQHRNRTAATKRASSVGRRHYSAQAGRKHQERVPVTADQENKSSNWKKKSGQMCQHKQTNKHTLIRKINKWTNKYRWMIYFPVCANYIWIVFKDLHKNVFIVHVYERMYFISCVFFF